MLECVDRFHSELGKRSKAIKDIASIFEAIQAKSLLSASSKVLTTFDSSEDRLKQVRQLASFGLFAIYSGRTFVTQPVLTQHRQTVLNKKGETQQLLNYFLTTKNITLSPLRYIDYTRVLTPI